MAKHLTETERKSLLQLQRFYLNVRREIDALEIRLGIKPDQQEPLEVCLQIESDGNKPRIKKH